MPNQPTAAQRRERPASAARRRMELIGLCRPRRPIITSAIMIGKPMMAMQAR
jgi:hypothetical protein